MCAARSGGCLPCKRLSEQVKSKIGSQAECGEQSDRCSLRLLPLDADLVEPLGWRRLDHGILDGYDTSRAGHGLEDLPALRQRISLPPISPQSGGT